MSLAKLLEVMELKPVLSISDKEQFDLLGIRNQPLIRESSYTTHVIDTEEHKAWLSRLGEEHGRFFHAVYLKSKLIGGVGLQVTEAHTGIWSFYVSQDAQGGGVGLALAVKALDLFFNEYGLERITGEALRSNTASVNFHLKLGFSETDIVERSIQPENQVVDVVCFALDKQIWGRKRDLLLNA